MTTVRPPVHPFTHAHRPIGTKGRDHVQPYWAAFGGKNGLHVGVGKSPLLTPGDTEEAAMTAPTRSISGDK